MEDLKRAKENWIPKNIGYAFVLSDDVKVIERFIKFSGKIQVHENHKESVPETQQTKL